MPRGSLKIYITIDTSCVFENLVDGNEEKWDGIR